jgi:Pyruvate/2-oxoacid:ferredoxin oxidoreductase delta subunit
LRITQECTECKACEQVCPLGIAPHSFKKSGIVADSDCLKCSLCVVRCPKQCLNLGEENLRRVA